MMNKALKERVEEHVKAREETLTEFYNRAIVNELERGGDFQIRDILESTEDEE